MDRRYEDPDRDDFHRPRERDDVFRAEPLTRDDEELEPKHDVIDVGDDVLDVNGDTLDVSDDVLDVTNDVLTVR